MRAVVVLVAMQIFQAIRARLTTRQGTLVVTGQTGKGLDILVVVVAVVGLGGTVPLVQPCTQMELTAAIHKTAMGVAAVEVLAVMTDHTLALTAVEIVRTTTTAGRLTFMALQARMVAMPL
jgi:hypothetical protein